MNQFDERRVCTQAVCFNCKHRASYESEWECFTQCYCMLGVSKSDLDHVNRIEGEDEEWDERFCNIMMVNECDEIEDSPRLVEPDDHCQFYEKNKDYFNL